MTEQDFESQLAEIRQGADFARTMETHYRERAEKLEELATQIWAEKRVQEIAAEARAQVAQKTHTLHITTGQAETRPSAFWRPITPVSGRPVPELVTLNWKAGDPCGVCGSTNTGWDSESGGFCRTCKATDADE